jgi:hypothetical protein
MIEHPNLMSSRDRRIGFLVLGLVLFSVTLRAQESPPAPAAPQELPEDVKEIVRRGLEADQHNFQLARNYTFERREELKVLDRKGTIKKHEIKTYDVTILYDEPYGRLIRKDDKPLPDKEEKKEADKLERFVSERKKEGEGEHKRRLAKQEKERQEARAFVQDIINAYEFRIVGEDQVDGHDTYVVEADPRKGFRPTQPHADILPKLRGKIWIDKKDYGWVKLQAETLDTISWGLFLLRIHKGTQMEFEQIRMNNEIWLPRRISLDASARFALVANGTFDFELTFSSYKKFTSDVRIVPGTAGGPTYDNSAARPVP